MTGGLLGKISLNSGTAGSTIIHHASKGDVFETTSVFRLTQLHYSKEDEYEENDIRYFKAIAKNSAIFEIIQGVYKIS